MIFNFTVEGGPHSDIQEPCVGEAAYGGLSVTRPHGDRDCGRTEAALRHLVRTQLGLTSSNRLQRVLANGESTVPFKHIFKHGHVWSSGTCQHFK